MTKNDSYEPPSKFLRGMIGRHETLGSHEEDRSTLAQLIEMTRDNDPANRDWATMLLWQQQIDTPEVRRALMVASEDNDENVRAEAIRGLAELDRTLALPLLRKALTSDWVSAPILEAAAIVADPSLIGDLRAFTASSGNDHLDHLAQEALTACEATVPRK
jgi:HEAT repeat protein